MRVPLNWLQEYVDLSGHSPQELARLLTLGLCEVEQVEESDVSYQDVVVGHILEVAPHPQADRLQLAKVNVGANEPLQIVCGASNIAPGQAVPVAQVGAQLPTEEAGKFFKIRKSKIRGETSQGMLCSQKELSLGSDHEGILQLDKSLQAGLAFDETLKRAGPVLIVDNKSLTHRSDCWGLMGLVREFGAILNRPFKTYEDLEQETVGSSSPVSVKVESLEACPRYHVLKISGLQVKPSPESWQKKLEACGVRSINNLVDATNLTMIEVGQPLHAFDSRFVSDESFVVRLAKPGEKFLALDEVERILSADDLVIADHKKVLALAGVMGGLPSAVSQETTTIFLEGANFDPGFIRRTSLRLGLRSDSSSRFEKGLSPWLVEVGLKRCLHYLKETCPDLKVESGLGDFSSKDPSSISLSLEKVNARLGQPITQKKVEDHLNRLGFGTSFDKDHLSVTLPPWRSTRDVSRAEDLIEEIGRLEGFSNLKPSLPQAPCRPSKLHPDRQLDRQLRKALAADCGLVEVLNYGFISQLRCQQIGCIENLYTLKNPVQKDRSALRPTLLGGLLDTLAVNHRNYESFEAFELGRVFLPNDSGELPQQNRRVAGLHYKGEKSFHAAKRALEALIDGLNLPSLEFQRHSQPPSWAHPGRASELVVANKKKKIVLGLLAEIHPRLLGEEGVSGRASLWEVDLEALKSFQLDLRAFKDYPRFPEVRRDLALLVDESVSVGEVVAKLKKGRPLLKKVELFDIYRSQDLPENNKSLAFHLYWQDPKRTLTDELVDTQEKEMLAQLTQMGWTRR